MNRWFPYIPMIGAALLGVLILVFLASGRPAKSDEGNHEHVDIWALCINNPLGAEAMIKIKAALKAGDNDAYNSVMRDPLTPCIDQRLYRHPPITGNHIVEWLSTIETVNGCMQLVMIQDRFGTTAQTWIGCRDTGA